MTASFTDAVTVLAGDQQIVSTAMRLFEDFFEALAGLDFDVVTQLGLVGKALLAEPFDIFDREIVKPSAEQDLPRIVELPAAEFGQQLVADITLVTLQVTIPGTAE